MMDQAATRASRRCGTPDYPLDAAAILLVEERRHGRGGGGRDGRKSAACSPRLARPRSACRRTRRSACCFWSGGKGGFPGRGRISPDYYCIDGTIPRKALPRVLNQIAAWSAEYDLRVANVFHAATAISIR